MTGSTHSLTARAVPLCLAFVLPLTAQAGHPRMTVETDDLSVVLDVIESGRNAAHVDIHDHGPVPKVDRDLYHLQATLTTRPRGCWSTTRGSTRRPRRSASTSAAKT